MSRCVLCSVGGDDSSSSSSGSGSGKCEEEEGLLSYWFYCRCPCVHELISDGMRVILVLVLMPRCCFEVQAQMRDLGLSLRSF